jgi:hypothetical protein
MGDIDDEIFCENDNEEFAEMLGDNTHNIMEELSQGQTTFIV